MLKHIEVLVEVVWNDAQAWAGWVSEATLRGTKDYILHTYGYLLLEDANRIIVAGEKAPDGDWKYVTFIPKAYILHIKYYREWQKE